MRTVTLKDGNVLHLHGDVDQLSNRILSDEDYFEKDILLYLEKNYPEQNVILDVGANIGNHTVFFATHFRYNKIIAFEPIPENYVLLEKNTRPFYSVSIRRVAIGDGDLSIRMRIDRENMGACEVTPEGDVHVEQIRLDDLFVDPVTLIKIDVEWYEPFVLLGAKSLIEEDKPLILIEDTNQEYGDLLPNYYKLIQAWPEHRTYLYGVQ